MSRIFNLPEDQWPSRMQRWYGNGVIQIRHPTGVVQEATEEELQARLQQVRERRAMAMVRMNREIAELELVLEKLSVTPELTPEDAEAFAAEVEQRMAELAAGGA